MDAKWDTYTVPRIGFFCRRDADRPVVAICPTYIDPLIKIRQPAGKRGWIASVVYMVQVRCPRCEL